MAPHTIVPPVFKYGNTQWDDHLRQIHSAVSELRIAQADAMRKSTGVLTAGFRDLRLELNWGFTLLHDQMAAQQLRLQEITESLRAIEETLKAPRRTRAREAFSIGTQHLRQGLLLKALEEFTAAEQLYEVDFLLQLQIGKIRLYGHNDVEDVVHLDEAERHLVLSERYGRAAQIDLGEKVDSFIGEACYHLAILKFMRSSCQFHLGEHKTARELLKETIKHLQESPASTAQQRLLLARCHCLLGSCDIALQILMALCDDDRNFAFLAEEEPDFAAMRTEIREIPGILRSHPGPATARAFSAREIAFTAIKHALDADSHDTVKSKLEDLGKGLRATDLALDSGEIDTATLMLEAQRVSSTAIWHLRQRVSQLNSNVVRPESPFAGGTFLAVLFWMGLLMGFVAIPIFIAVLGDFGKPSEWWWFPWSLATIFSTTLILYIWQTRFLLAQRRNENIVMETSRINQIIRDLEA